MAAKAHPDDLVTLRTWREATNTQLATTKGNAAKQVERKTTLEFKQACDEFEDTHRIDWEVNPQPRARWINSPNDRDSRIFEIVVTYLVIPTLRTRLRRLAHLA